MRIVASTMIPAAVALLTGCFAAQRPISSIVAAAREGDAAAVRRLAKEGADVNAPDGGNGWTPLLHAVHKDRIRSVEALLDAGADVNRTAENGVTPLMMAAGYGYTDIVQVLLRRGARASLQNQSGESALDWALTGVTDIDRFTWFSCQDGTVRALLAAGVPPHASASARRWASFKRCESATMVR
jgi:hypothetical protein